MIIANLIGVLCLALATNAQVFTEAHKKENSPAMQHLKKGREYASDLAKLGKDNENLRPGMPNYEKVLAQGKAIQRKIFDEDVAAINAFISQPKEVTDINDFARTVGNFATTCSYPVSVEICDRTLASAAPAIESLRKGKSGIVVESALYGGLQSIGQYFYNRGNYRAAMQHLRAIYDEAAKYQCDARHTYLLALLLNTAKKSNDEKTFDAYLKIAKWCETSPKLERKGAKFQLDERKNEVLFVEPPRESITPREQANWKPPETKEVVWYGRQEFINEVRKATQSLYSGDDDLLNKVLEEMAKDGKPESTKYAEQGKKNRDKNRRAATAEYEKLLASDPLLKKQQLSNLLILPPSGATRSSVTELFGEPAELDQVQRIAVYQLYTGGQMVFLTVGAPKAGYYPPRAPVSFKFSEDNKLVEISFQVNNIKHLVR